MDQEKTEAFLKDLKEVLRKHHVVINDAEYDCPAEFRYSDDRADYIWVPINSELESWSKE